MATTEIAESEPALPAATNKKLEACAAKITKANEKVSAIAVAAVFTIGEQLKIANDELSSHGYGTFTKWAVESCGLSKSSIFSYLAIWDAFGHRRELVCPPSGQTIDVSALKYLSRDTVVEDAIDDAIELVKSGERVTLAKAKGIVESYTVDAASVSDPVEIEGDGDEIDFPQLVQDTEDAVRAAFCNWPDDCYHYIPKILRALAEEEHSKWKRY